VLHLRNSFVQPQRRKRVNDISGVWDAEDEEEYELVLDMLL